VTTQGLSRIAGGIAIVAVLVVSGMVAWSVLRRQDPDLAVQQAETPRSGEPIRLGDLTGYLGQIDAAAGTIVVAADPTGADPVTLAWANDASVTVNGTQGGLADLAKDMPVRVFYEVRNEVKHVTSIQVVTDRPQAAPSPSETAPAGEPKAAVEVKSPAESRPAPVSPAAQAKDPVESKPPAESRPPAEVKPAAPPAVRPTPPPPPATAVTPRPAPAPAATAPPDPPRAPAAGPAGRDDDGSAAVDWLLKGSGRR
jgi:hypothetical protein